MLLRQARTLAVLADIYEDVARNTWGDKVTCDLIYDLFMICRAQHVGS